MKLVIAALSTALLLAISAGCGATQRKIEHVRHRAAFDLRCPKRQVLVITLSTTPFGGTYGVKACGRQATYNVLCETRIGQGCQAILDARTQP